MGDGMSGITPLNDCTGTSQMNDAKKGPGNVDSDILEVASTSSNKSKTAQNTVSSPATPSKRKRSTSKSPRKSPLLRLEESLKNVAKKGSNTKSTKKKKDQRQVQENEEQRQTQALEDMVKVVKGAVAVNKAPKAEATSRERLLSVIHDRMVRMESAVSYPEINCEAIHNQILL